MDSAKIDARMADWTTKLRTIQGVAWARFPLERARENWSAGWVRRADSMGWPEIAIFGFDENRVRARVSAAGLIFQPFVVLDLDADGATLERESGPQKWALASFDLDCCSRLIWEASV
ncbi:hypothetical protein [Neomegalonema perideroedes]|uniref:hypothetical protein n=1 Tax=Neomegalonema perideroedes TaxID=217219 RepID=UPI000379796E|nr:hypothetical protein [Neomegalonema perideroedes]